MSFSLKTLFAAFTILAVTLVGSRKLHSLYCLRVLDRSVEIGNGCSILETLAYANDQGFRAGWANRTWATAAKRGDFYTLKYFSKKDDINREIEGDSTALMLAAENGHFNATKFLLVHGADATICNANGLTAYDLAITTKHLEVAKLLEVSQGDTWKSLIDVEEMIYALMVHSQQSYRVTLDELLGRKDFAKLTARRIAPNRLQAENQDHWFKVDEVFSIGFSSSSREFSWMLDSNIVTNVEFFSLH